MTDEMKCNCFQAAVVSILLYGCTTWTLTKRMEKKLDGNYTRMLRAILNKSWRQHPTKTQLYGHLPPITKTIQVRRTRHAGHCWGSRDELMNDVLQWTPSYGRANVRIRDVALRTSQKRWPMGKSGEWGSGISVLAARHEDDIYIYIYIYIYGKRSSRGVYLAKAIDKDGSESTWEQIKLGKCYHQIRPDIIRSIQGLERIKIKIRCCPCGLMVKAIACDIVVSEFKLQSRHCVQDIFGQIPLGKVWTPYPPSFGLSSTTNVLLEQRFWHWMCQWPSSQPLSSPQFSHNDSLWA